ncbi:hypothetical protein MMC28_006247 [Mycoblastus sanguinarius]|nr:hypothetical protein [Mycoblastus sanguinarius]
MAPMELPSLTKTWRKASYPAISPTKPSLSVTGKTVFITGGGRGVGVAIARAFAVAGASTIAITGRTEKSLLSTKKEIESSHPTSKVLTLVADITDHNAIEAAFSTVGKVDILINNAGYQSDVLNIADSDLSDWWAGFEINVKGAFIVSRAFLKVAARDAIVVNMTTGLAELPASPGASSYGASKLAAAKFHDALQVENPALHVVNVHPGVIITDMSQKALDAGASFPIDDIELPASFVVWACSAEARFLKGKNVWANMDVEELKEKEHEIKTTSLLTITLEGLSSFKYSSASAN